jgi:pyruvate dehydrogenase (quinone)/pyruvate oxidase
LRFPVEIGLCGDAKATLQVLQTHVGRRDDRSFLEAAQAGMQEWRKTLNTRAHRTDMPLKPQVVADTLNDLLADDAIISTDSGTITAWAARYIQVRRNQLFSCSGISRRWRRDCLMRSPRRSHIAKQAIAFVGDGGFTMLMGEFATAVIQAAGSRSSSRTTCSA